MEAKSKNASRAVANWVLIGVIMLLIQVVLGGITRLTGSGLSITEWDVLRGSIPPLTESAWLDAFSKYRETPQYHLINTDFTLADYKFIYFWEWFHRFWARLVGVVFIVGFVYLLVKKKIRRSQIRPLIFLFVLGGLQGAVGWIMVASGLQGDAVYVAPARLALHFVFALGLIACTYWFYLDLTTADARVGRSKSMFRLTISILGLIFIQLIYGALMAGYKGANSAPTWPTINGEWIPSSLSGEHGFLVNLFDNKIKVQFIHRSLAYLIFVMVIIWTVKAWKPGEPAFFQRRKWWPLVIVSWQIILGISALLLSPAIVANRWVAFDWVALLHQVSGMLFLLTMIYMLFLFRPRLNQGK